MTVAVLARPSARRLRPGVRRGLMAGASVLMHTLVLGAMALLAANEDQPVFEPPPPPIIQLQIERPTPPVPHPVPPVAVPLIEPQPLPDVTPVPLPAPQPTPLPTPQPAPRTLPQPTPQPAQPAPQVAPQTLPQTILQAPPRAAPKPVPAPPAPVPLPAPAPAPAAAAERAAPVPAPVVVARPRKKDEDEARNGPPAAPAPRLANPAPGAPSAAASGVDGVSDAWRVAPEGQAGRNARALRTSPAGCPSTAILTRGEQLVCDERFNARAAEGATRPITGTGNAQRDARFAREGAREMQRYEAQRRPLGGGVGVLPPADCPGSNFGTGCAGAHLRDVQGVDMRQGARSTVNEGERRTSGLSANVGGVRVGGD